MIYIASPPERKLPICLVSPSGSQFHTPRVLSIETFNEPGARALLSGTVIWVNSDKLIGLIKGDNLEQLPFNNSDGRSIVTEKEVRGFGSGKLAYLPKEGDRVVYVRVVRDYTPTVTAWGSLGVLVETPVPSST